MVMLTAKAPRSQGLSVPGENFLQKYGVSEGLATISTEGGHPHKPRPKPVGNSPLSR